MDHDNFDHYFQDEKNCKILELAVAIIKNASSTNSFKRNFLNKISAPGYKPLVWETELIKRLLEDD